ncbi:hypothetical protein [Tropicibacter oceani]|uniref:Secreted protein n=1 Tax=Tropicibacter oceani TaxID=3058420 RepID=A0ABY8QFM9_9RHOB|nr:hypothetical protein [Tropicibacter oceani]WGW03325.1 hypothetical protein QF118_15545 [Tropicibacter oceani]
MTLLKISAMALGFGVLASAALADQQCWVGVKPNDSSQVNIACTQTYGMGSQILAQKGYSQIVYGPATYDQCQAYIDKTMAKG